MSSPFFRPFIKRIEIALRKAFIAILALRTTEKFTHYPLRLPESPTIVFLRQDRIGDAIISTPLLAEVRKKFPSARIIMLLGENNKAIIPLLPIECEVAIYKKNLLQDIRTLLGLRKQKIDVVLDLMDNPSVTSSVIVSLLGATYSIGVEKDNAAVYSVTVPQLDHHSNHITDRIALLLEPLGIAPSSFSLRPVIRRPEVKTVAGRVGLNLSAGSPNRELSIATNAEIAKGLLSDGLANQVLLLYHPKDVQRARDIAGMANNSNVVVAPITSGLSELAEQLGTCESLITPDTSIVHMAAAYDIPLVGIYIEATMHNFHYWTPVGVQYEMIVYPETFEHVKVAEVLGAFKKLHTRVQDIVTTIPQTNTTHVA